MISWSPPDWDGGRPVTGYRLFALVEGSDPQLLEQLGPGENGSLRGGLVNGEVYVFAVRALTVVGTSDLSQAVEARPVGLPAVPLGIEAFWVDGRVLVTWDPPSDDGGSPVLAYVVHRTDKAPSDALVTTGLTIVDPGVEPGTSYNYTVRVRTAVGDGPPLQVTFEVPEEEPPPVEPEALDWTYMALVVVIVALAAALAYVGLRGRTRT
jgi:hypothetical protein